MTRIIIPALLLTALSHAAEARTSFEEAFQNSRNLWEQLKRPDLSYRYTTSYESWIGLGQTTRIDVVGDQVIGRNFEAWRWYYDWNDNSTYKRETIRSWTESAQDIGQHPEGERAKTLDQVYAECRDHVLSLDPERYEIEFKVDTRGLIQTCRARDIYCADDCWEGIDIVTMEI